MDNRQDEEPRYCSAPVLWPATGQLRVGAVISIAVVLGVVLLVFFRPWESTGKSTYGNGLDNQGSVAGPPQGGDPQ